MICLECRGESPENARFCVNCGRSLPRCAACGAAMALTYRFCPGCGRAALSAELPSAPPARVPPAPLPRPPSTAPPLPEQERRQVAILFADLVGFTALAEQRDPEKVHEIAQSCLTSLAEIVVAHGGHVDKFIGDCIMALFGAPVAHEDDAARAVAAGLAMLARLDGMNGAIEAEYGIRLALRVGVNAGPVIAGEIGRPGEYTVIGDAVNVASRIQGLAQPGSVVVAGTVRVLAAGAYQFRPAGTVALKNRTVPVEIFEAADLSTAPAGSTENSSTPFVGRRSELSRLQAALAAARAGRGAALRLVAEAGMGKSRLVQELASRAAGQLPILIGHCRDYAAPLYLPFRQWFEQLESEAEALGLGDPAEWDHLLPYPEEFQWLRWTLFPERAPPVSTDPETAQRVAHRTFLQFLEGLARRAPLLLVVEDLNWADALSLELLEALARAAPRLPVLLIGTARPDATVPQCVTELPLGPLDPGALEELLTALLAPESVSPAAAEWLIPAAHGNPFFLEELTRSLQAAGDLVRRGERWELARPLRELRVPDTVRGVVQARLDALDPLARMVVREAAVLGSPFDVRVLRSMTTAPGELDELLASLEEARILAPPPAREPHRRGFHQALIQQVAYESLLSRRRRELHERAARQIEALHAGRESEVVEDLAEHYAQAEVTGAALRYLEQAALRAQALYANDRARAHYLRLLEIAGDHPQDVLTDGAAVATAEGGLADLEGLAGEFEAASERLRLALDRAPAALPPEIRAGLHRRLGELHAKQGQPEAADAALEAALALTEHAASPPGHQEAARAWYRRAALRYRRGEYAGAEAALAESARQAAAGEDAAAEANCLLLRGLIQYDTGQRQAARRDLEAALHGKEATGDLRGMAAALNNLGNLAIDEGRTADARTLYTRALELRRRIGHEEGIAAAEISLGNVALSLGQWEAAREYLAAAEARSERMGDAYGALAAAVNQARLALETGDAAPARARFETAGERARELNYANLAIEAQIGLAEAEAALGEPARAAEAATAAVGAAAATGDPILLAAARRAAAMAHGAAGQSAAAAADFLVSRQAFHDLEQPLEEVRTLVRWAAVLDNSDEAAALLAEAEALARPLEAAGELARIAALRAPAVNPPTGSGTRPR